MPFYPILIFYPNKKNVLYEWLLYNERLLNSLHFIYIYSIYQNIYIKHFIQKSIYSYKIYFRIFKRKQWLEIWFISMEKAKLH